MFVPLEATADVETLQEINDAVENLPSEEQGEVTDGHHTFDQLYEYRCLYNAALFNLLAREPRFEVHKSLRHSDGETCFGKDTLFIVMATLPSGQISNHYKKSEWDLFHCEERERAAEYDGHTPEDAAKRLREFCESLGDVASALDKE